MMLSLIFDLLVSVGEFYFYRKYGRSHIQPASFVRTIGDLEAEAAADQALYLSS